MTGPGVTGIPGIYTTQVADPQEEALPQQWHPHLKNQMSLL